ncbi:hypothetical protein C1H46_035524 [Malus baccata]|uniref:Uncharacterized protein n=1 Tax=Malus baccata TaxID=106549 RepID=A0A540KXF3_MALBA|nr:hypothetical protein C1H46_035523 [Malus baccata]TQD78916.1 hypothetical protein C1H46_035524 [Malus baccata]
MDATALDHPSGPSDDVDPGLTDFHPSSEPAFYSSAAASAKEDAPSFTANA